MELTGLQLAVVEQVCRFIKDENAQVFILKGYAGTGKTTLVKTIADKISQWLTVKLMAPTGRAARVLSDKTGREATTIHRAIYKAEGLKEGKDKSDFKFHFLINDTSGEKIAVIVDEASMLGSRTVEQELFEFGTGNLMNDLLTYARPGFGGKLIFVGDPAQLPPVGETESVALSAAFFTEKGLNVMEAELTDVMRQAGDSVILGNAMLIRDLLKKKVRNRLAFAERKGEVESLEPVDLLDRYFDERRLSGLYSSVVICFSNKVAADYTRGIRSRLYGTENAPLHKGETLMVVQNNYVLGRMNGEFVPVLEVGGVSSLSAPVYVQEGAQKEKRIITMTFQHVTVIDGEGNQAQVQLSLDLLNDSRASLSVDQQKMLYINFCMRNPDLSPKSEEFMNKLQKDPYFNCLRAKYGYAVTGHKCQGGEWKKAFVDYNGRTGLSDDCLRWVYTATTRARETLYITNLPHITPFSNFKIETVQRCNKVNPECRVLGAVCKSVFHDTQAPDYLHAKCVCVQSNFEYTPFRIAGVDSKPYKEIYHIATPSGLERYDINYKAGGIFGKAVPLNPTENSVLVCQMLDNEQAMPFVMNYVPVDDIHRQLYCLIRSAADSVNVQITNVVDHPEDYSVMYYFRTSGTVSYIKIYIDKKGFVSYAKPMSLVGADDKELVELVDRIKEYFV